MESQKKASNGGMEGVESREKKTPYGGCDLVLRVFALMLTLVPAILLGVDKQTTVVPVLVSPNLPPLNVPATAKWNYLSAFVYFVATNAVSCAYAALSLLLSIGSRKGSRGLAFVIIVVDVVMVALLFSGNGAAAAVGLIGYRGNSHVEWNKVCDVFGKFCDRAAAAIALSLVGSLAYLLLVVLAAFRIQKKLA